MSIKDSVKPADARVVAAVRKLKSNKMIDSSEVRKNQDESKSSRNITNDKTIIDCSIKKTLTPVSLKSDKSSNPNFTDANNIITNNIINSSKIGTEKKELIRREINSKITVDGSIQKPNTSSSNSNNTINTNSNNSEVTINSNKKGKVFDYETLKRYNKKPKTEYQKNILCEKNILKYKEECLNLIKKDKEIQNLLEKLNIVKNNNYLPYINDNFFSKQHFLFTLEILILETTEEQSTLKVFRTNKNVQPLKVVKENYYKNEILKDLKIRFFEMEYRHKYQNLFNHLNGFVSKIKNEKLKLD